MKEALRAAGYLSVFVPPVLLVGGLAAGHPILACAGVFVVSPFLRSVFGDVDESVPPQWSEEASTFLDLLPVAYAATFPIAVAAALLLIHRGALKGSGDWIAAAFSFWTCFIFATVIGHELVHQRVAARRRLGRVLAGLVGYPVLGHEHMPHHATSGNVADAEWPAAAESLWSFVGRRIARVLRSAFEYDAALAMRLGGRLRSGLAEAACVTAITGVAFAVAGGSAGALLYVVLVAAVWFAIQAITYLQHWGLGLGDVAEAHEGQYAWEDGCRLQAWLTLSISFHQAHHLAPSVPYYRVAPVESAPRLPAGYVFMLVAALFPPLWRRMMRPALEQWRSNPAGQLRPGRRLICFYRVE